MLRISNIQFVYNQENKVAGYRVAFDGDGSAIKMLSGSIELSNEEIDLTNVTLVVQKKLASVLDTSE